MGVGEIVVFRFPKSKFAQGRKTIPLRGFLVLNGFQRDGASWKQYARARTLRITLNNAALFELRLKDERVAQTFEFDAVDLRPGDELTFEILDAYPGASELPIALSALEPLGAH